MHYLRRTSVATLAVFVLGLFWFIAPTQAQVTSTFTGNIDGTEPESYEVDDSTCTIIETLFHYYETYEMYVTVSGAYDYTDLSIFYDLDMQLTVYTDSYDPSSVLTNCVTRYDDSGTFNLMAGQQYIFVVQSLFHDSFNTGDWEFEMVGPGSVIMGTVPVEEPVEAGPLMPFTYDGRINNFDAAAPIVIYPDNAGGFAIYTADGEYIMAMTAADFEAAGVNSTSTMVGSHSTLNTQVYRLSDGRYHVVADQYNGKKYHIQFSSPYANASAYNSWED
jgi:hypothetical protein